MKADIIKRLCASLHSDAIHGNRDERSVCAAQMAEAASAIKQLRAEITKLKAELARKPVCVGYASRQEFKNLTQYISRVTVREPTVIFCHAIYIETPDREIAQQGEEG